jgi:Protein of unknown function (DUF3147)
MKEMVVRFFVGGLVVSLFSTLADIFRPKSFAGLLGAAPSIALATLGLTILHDGEPYAAFEARSMIFGALGFLIYALLVSCLLRHYRPAAMTAAFVGVPIWFAVSLGLWYWIGSTI